MPITTLECRWFFRSRPREWEEWITRSRSAFAVPEHSREHRIDRYAPIASCAMSLKLRNQVPTQLEAKCLFGKQSVRPRGGSLTAFQRWQKIVTALPSGDREAMFGHSLAHWTSVEKDRRLLFVDPDRDSPVTNAANKVTPTKRPIQLEWSEIRIAMDKHWTFAVEASGEHPIVELADLLYTVRRRSGIEPSDWAGEMAYPEFLRKRLSG